jgi:hypothetical protein
MSEARARERKKQAEGQHAAPSSVQQLSLEQVRLASAAAEFEASWRACGLRVHKARERVRGMAGRMLAVDDAVAAAGAAPTGRPRPAGPDGASLGESFFVVPSGARAQAGRPSSKAADEAAPPGPAETARRGLALVALVLPFIGRCQFAVGRLLGFTTISRRVAFFLFFKTQKNVKLALACLPVA